MFKILSSQILLWLAYSKFYDTTTKTYVPHGGYLSRKYQNHPDLQKLKTKSLQMLPKASNQ